MGIRITVVFIAFLLCNNGGAQNKEYAKKVIDELCSENFSGRGYVNDGAQKAANYIKREYESAGLKPIEGKSFFQEFGFPVVAFPARVELKLEGRDLVSGEEFIVSPGCQPLSGVYELYFVDSASIDNATEYEKITKLPLFKTFLVVDGLKDKKFKHQDRADRILSNAIKAKGHAYVNQEKFNWSVATEWDKFPTIHFVKGLVKSYYKQFSIIVESEMRSHQAVNIIGQIRGAKNPDSIIVFSAHYDHLGMMGKWALFPGANDNASGVAMMLDLMKHYAVQKPDYTIVFIAFAGEEAGLFGSYYYTTNPFFPLKRISMLINLDLMGTGDKGMTVVNGTLFPKEFQDIQLINVTNNYLPAIMPRGKAQNSDHYFFSENGVKAFFFYLMGEYKFYHDVFDTPEALTLSRYNEAFSLIRDFVDEYMQ